MICPECGHLNPGSAKFCMECGVGLTESPRVNSVSKSERKQVTVLFSDLSGYTAMNERLDPEEVKDIMSRIFVEITQVVIKYDGFIERFVGDAVMAIFGIPTVHEDDPIRAIQAALEIHALVKALSPKFEPKLGQQLSMHSGINTGLVVTGEVNLEKGTHGLTGDTINLASRLEGLAGTNEIVAGKNTYKLARSHFRFEPMKPTKVKGKSKFISAFKVVSAKKADSRMGSDRQVSSVMVGRDQETDRLAFQVHKVLNGQGSVVNVVGEAGIGKSRLMAELKKRAVMQRVTFLEGRSISIGRNLSFHPIIDLLKQWARITEDDSEMQAFDKLDRAIRSIHPTETDEILPFVATLMGMKMRGRHADRMRGIKGEALEKLIFKNFRELIAKGSELRPMVIIMEDMHWADNSSLTLLQYLYRLTEHNRLLFVNVLRPGYLEEDGAIAAAKAHETIEIQPLASLYSEALINNMLKIKGLPFSLKEQIVVRAGGNPFFIEEVVRSLIDDGAVVRGANGFEVTDRIDRVVIPPTINEVLLARLDRLEEQTRELVKVASIIGRSFFDRIIKDVADSIDGVDHRLSYLKDMQLIRERRRMQELEYLFSHALAQEAAYESTLIQQRKALHLKVAQSIEKIFTERLHEFYGMLAHHYGMAGNEEKTEEYLIKAGEEALKSSASSEALNYLQKALKLYIAKYGSHADPEKLANLEKNIALAYHNKAQHKEAIKYFDMALERYGMPVPKWPGGISKALWGFLILLKVCYWKLPDTKKSPTTKDYETYEIYGRSGEAFSHSDPPRTLLGALDWFRYTNKFGPQLPRMSFYWSHITLALMVTGIVPFRICNRLLEISKRYVDEQDIIGNLKIILAEIISDTACGEWETIYEPDRDLLNKSLKIGEFFYVSVCLRRYGLVKLEQGEFAFVKEAQEKLQEIGETYDQVLAVLSTLEMKTIFLLITSSAQEAIVVADEGISYANKMNNLVFEIVLLGHKAEAQQFIGDTEGANDSLSQALKLNKEQQVITPSFYTPYLAARLSVELEQVKLAIRLNSSKDVAHMKKSAYKTGKAALKNVRTYAPCRAKIFRLMGNYYWLNSSQRKALKWWYKSIQEGERLGARPDLSRTYFQVGKHLMEPESKYRELNGIEARDYLEKARTLFKEMGLRRDLDELYQIISHADADDVGKTSLKIEGV